MKQDTDRVREHFVRDAQRFDAIYETRKSLRERFVDSFRGVVVQRFNLAVERAGDVKGKALLDVGCGSGRWPIRFLQEGAAKAVGIDFADSMIALAKQHAAELGLSERCEFQCGDFLTWECDRRFDITTVMGFFDYVADAEPFLRRAASLTDGLLFASFPVVNDWRVPYRRWKFGRLNCPVYFYTEAQVRAVMERAGIADYRLERLSRDYFVQATIHP
jgi:2-polyprenyl-3-methyl-5-hydroxy-6-metoxy-1,4-benzoquinol methylase